jgi:hypothetical protein
MISAGDAAQIWQTRAGSGWHVARSDRRGPDPVGAQPDPVDSSAHQQTSGSDEFFIRR